MPFRSTETTSGVMIPVGYGENLSKVADSFGARSKREARRYPGSFDRPVVGRDTQYFARRARKVVDDAVRSDKVLTGLFDSAWKNSHEIHKRVQYPSGYVLGGSEIVVDSAIELLDNASKIDEGLETLDLKMSLEGRWLERATNVSAFALRVIDSTNRLYQGMDPDLPINTTNYWEELAFRLIPAHED